MPKNTVFISCFLAMSEDTIRSLSVISKALIKQGFSVMVAGNEPPANLTDHPDFQYLQIPFRIADYEKLDNIESTSIIDESSWMAEVDSTWCLPNLGPEHSAKRIDSCKKHALKALQEVSPKVAFLWSSGVFPSSFIWKQACDSLGIPAFCIERGWLPGTWMLDRGGMQAQSDIVSHPVFRKKSLEHNKSKAAREYINWHQNEHKNYKCNNRDINLLTLGSADYAGVSPRTRPGNILNSPGFTSSEHVASTIESIYPLSGNPKWIYRPHPFHSGDEYPFLKKCHLDIGTDAISLINRSETVVCGLSTLQFQALLCGCSIILTARSPLMGLPGVTEALSPDALAEAIRKPNLKTSLCHKTVLFIDFLLSYACFTVNPTIPGQSADEFFSHIHHLVDKNIDSKDNNSHKLDDLKNLERHAANSLYVILKSDDPVQLIQKIKLENQQLNNQLLAAQSQIEELGAWGNAQNLIITQRDQRIIDLQNEAERFATWARQCDQDVTVARNWAQDNNREVQRLRELLNIAQQRIGELGTWGSNQDQAIAQRDQRIIELQNEVERLATWGRQLDQDATAARDWAQDNNREVQRLHELLATEQQRIDELGTWGSNQDQAVAQRDQRIIELQNDVERLATWAHERDHDANAARAWAQDNDREAQRLRDLLATAQQRIDELGIWGSNQDRDISERNQRIIKLQNEVEQLATWARERDQDATATRAWAQDNDRQVQRLRDLLAAAQQRIDELGTWGSCQDQAIAQRDQRIIELQNEVEQLATWACERDQDNDREVQRLSDLLAKAHQRIDELGTWGSNQDQVIAQRDQRIIELQKEVASLGAWGQGLDLALQQQAERIRNLEDSLADQQEVHQQTLEVLLYTQTELQALQARFESEQQARIALEDRVARIWAPIRRWCLPKPR